jgi:hypothetical protein
MFLPPLRLPHSTAHMDFPLDLRFKLLALAPQLHVTDARGASVLYIQQRLFRLKEKIAVFSDASKQRQILEINADRMLDFSANYRFSVPNGAPLGAIRRHGMKSLWRAHYEIANAAGETVFTLTEENPWAKIGDSILGEIPIIGLLSGLFFHPRYRISRAGSDVPAFRLHKKRSFLESGFHIEKLDQAIGEGEEMIVLLATVMLTLLERRRG